MATVHARSFSQGMCQGAGLSTHRRCDDMWDGQLLRLPASVLKSVSLLILACSLVEADLFEPEQCASAVSESEEQVPPMQGL